MPNDTIDFQADVAVDFQPETTPPSLRPLGSPPYAGTVPETVRQPYDVAEANKPTGPTNAEAVAAVQTPYVSLPQLPTVDEVPPTFPERVQAKVVSTMLGAPGRLITENQLVAAQREAVNQAVGMVEFFESPAGGAALAGSALAPTATAGYFAYDLLTSAYRRAKEASSGWDALSPTQKAQAVVQVGGPVLLGALSGRHALSGIGKRLPQESRTLNENVTAMPLIRAADEAEAAQMPATAEALRQKAAEEKVPEPTALTPQPISSEGPLSPAAEIGPGLSPPPEPAAPAAQPQEVNAEGIRSDTGLVGESRNVIEEGQSNRGGNMEQAPPGQPQPVVTREGESAPLQGGVNAPGLAGGTQGAVRGALTAEEQAIERSRLESELEGGVARGQETPEVQVAPTPGPGQQPAPGSQLGIAPPGTSVAMRVIDWFRKVTPQGTPSPIRVQNRDVPRLSPQEELRATITRPHGVGRIPVIGRLFDPRYRGGDEINGAFIVNAYSREVGHGIGAILAAKFKWADELFKGMPISDVAEAYYADRNAAIAQYRLSAEQQRALDEAKPILDDTLEMMREEGIPRAVALRELLEDNPNAYFPRVSIGKEGVETGAGPGGGPGLSPNTPSLKKRIFASEAEGVAHGIIYEPSFSARIGSHVSRAYTAVANYRLLNDVKSHGKTVRMRFEELAEGVYPELAAIKAAVGNSTDPAQQRALMSAYFEKFDEIRKMDPDIFSDLREQAEHVTWGKEGTVQNPFFHGWIFPKDLADKINARVAPTHHAFVNLLKQGSLLSKSFMLALDNSAPLVQGLPLFFWSLAKRKNVWGRSVAANLRAWFDPEYLSHELSKPGMQELAREFVQLGGSLGRLDYLEGTSKGGISERVPGIGRAFRHAGAAFGGFMDMGKLYFWKSIRDTVPEGERAAVVEAIENTLGSARTRSIGMHPGTLDAMTILELASAYYRSAPNLVAAMFEKGFTGKLARESIGYFTGGVILTTAGFMYAAGLSPDQILEKFKRMDLTVPMPWFGGKKINVGFTHILLSLSKLVDRAILYAADDKPMTGGGVHNNPWLRWVWAHTGPVPSFAAEMATGRDFMGQKSDMGSALVKRVIPIAASQFSTSAKREQPQTAVGDALPSLLGLNAWPQTYRQAYEEKANQAARKTYGMDYSRLNLSEQAEITATIQKDKALQKKPEITPMQLQAALEAETKRLDLIRSGLKPDIAKKLDSANVRLRGFEAFASIGKIKVYLSTAQQEQMASIIATKINEAVSGMDFSGVEPERAQKLFDKLMLGVRKQSNAEFIARDEQAKGSHKPVKP